MDIIHTGQIFLATHLLFLGLFMQSHLFVSAAKCNVIVNWELGVWKRGCNENIKYNKCKYNVNNMIYWYMCKVKYKWKHVVKGFIIRIWLRDARLIFAKKFQSNTRTHLYQRCRQTWCPCPPSAPAWSSTWDPRCADSVGRRSLGSPF